MPTDPDVTQEWAALQRRLPGTAIAVGTSSPTSGRAHSCAGHLGPRAVTSFTTFYGASLTKQLVAALVARAVLDGHVDPQATLSTFLPTLPAWAAPIRVHHLVHHTAALPQPPELALALGHPGDEAGCSRLDNQAVLTALQRVAPPTAAPGGAFSYDNTGYILLAELLRAVHGRDVGDLARSEVFAPLGLAGSRVGGPAPLRLPGRPVPPATVGDGGLWTCAADLLTWLEAMNEERLGADLAALVQSPGRLDDGTVLDYAWGVGPRPGPAGTRYVHGGSWSGWCGMTVRCPTTATAAVVLAATDDMAAVSTAALELHDGLLSPRPPGSAGSRR